MRCRLLGLALLLAFAGCDDGEAPAADAGADARSIDATPAADAAPDATPQLAPGPDQLVDLVFSFTAGDEERSVTFATTGIVLPGQPQPSPYIYERTASDHAVLTFTFGAVHTFDLTWVGEGQGNFHETVDGIDRTDGKFTVSVLR
jgi:hypothetical protein